LRVPGPGSVSACPAWYAYKVSPQKGSVLKPGPHLVAIFWEVLRTLGDRALPEEVDH
jgi:hypothetical protein